MILFCFRNSLSKKKLHLTGLVPTKNSFVLSGPWFFYFSSRPDRGAYSGQLAAVEISNLHIVAFAYI